MAGGEHSVAAGGDDEGDDKNLRGEGGRGTAHFFGWPLAAPPSEDRGGNELAQGKGSDDKALEVIARVSLWTRVCVAWASTLVVLGN